MQRGRKIVALTLAVLLVLSVMSCFTFAAPAYSALPEGYLVVDTTWTGLAQQEKFDYELGGELYQLEYGVTAFSSIEAATAAWLPDDVERTIVLAPGLYASAMTLTSDVNLCGPYFGKNPNNNPYLDDYDPSMEDWALKNGRSIDPTKEAVFTANLSIGTGCNNVTIDGIAFTGGGKIIDTSRTNQKIIVNYKLKNLYFKDSTAPQFFTMRSTATSMVNRYVYIDQIRAENNNSIANITDAAAEVLEISNSFIKDMRVGDTSVTSVIEYMRGIPTDNSLSVDNMIRHTYKNNHFENIGGTNAINFAARESGTASITQRSRVILEIVGNDFIDVGTNGLTIQDQIAATMQEFICKDNNFIMTKNGPTKDCTAINCYYDGAGNDPDFTHVEISGNYFKGYSAVIAGLAKAPYFNVSPNNEAYDANGNAMAVASNANVTIASGDKNDNLVLSGKDSEFLKYGDTRRIYIYPAGASAGYYNFSDAQFTTVSGTQLEVYAAMKENGSLIGDPISRIALNTEENVTKVYLQATNGSEKQIYEISIFSFPPEEVVDTSGSDQCKLYDLEVKGAEVITRSDKGFIVMMKDGVKSISPKLSVSKNASYQFYMDAACKYATESTASVKLNSKYNFFYIQVTAENGTVSDPIPVTVVSDRKAVTYADAVNVPSYAREAVNYLNNNGYGIFVGDQNNKLNPRANITRYELAKVMVVLTGINVEMAESVKLNEIYDDFFAMQKEAAWALPYIRAATAAGLIQGVSDKGNLYFNGSATTSREQFATVFMRSVATSAGTTVNAMYKKNAAAADKAFKNKFNDAAQISSWALKAVKLANYFGFVQGDGTNFNPDDNIIRADVAVIVYNHSTSK